MDRGDVTQAGIRSGSRDRKAVADKGQVRREGG
jgi:hypothetical protein